MQDAPVATRLDREVRLPHRRARRARHTDHEVADESTERMVGVLRDRRGQKILPGVRQERDLVRSLGERREPVFVDQRAVAEILDARAAPLEDPRRDPRARQIDRAEHTAEGVTELRERRPSMRRAEVEDPAHPRHPALGFLAPIVTRAPGHEPAHAVADDREVLDGYGVDVEKALKLLREIAAVLGHVTARVVAQGG